MKSSVPSAIIESRRPAALTLDARRNDEIDRLGELLNLTVDRVGDAGSEIDDALQQRAVGVLQVHDHDLAVAQRVRDLDDVLEAARREDADLGPPRAAGLARTERRRAASRGSSSYSRRLRLRGSRRTIRFLLNSSSSRLFRRRPPIVRCAHRTGPSRCGSSSSRAHRFAPIARHADRERTSTYTSQRHGCELKRARNRVAGRRSSRPDRHDALEAQAGSAREALRRAARPRPADSRNVRRARH